MHPKVDDSLFPDSIPADVVFDMIYNPTRLRCSNTPKNRDAK